MAHFPILGGKLIVTAAIIRLVLCTGLAAARAGDTPAPALLVLHKGENAMAIIDPNSGAVLGRAPTGQDPHELAISEDEAYRTMQRESRQRRRSMREIAEAILLSDRLRKGQPSSAGDSAVSPR